MLNYMVGSDNSENGMICYYGEDDIVGGYPKRKFEESEEGFEKGTRKKRYILGQNVGKWTDEEHNRFVLALKKFGRNWTLVQQEVKTRTLVQIRSHAQKYFLKKVRGIAPSTLTMDSKLISTASDGIVPTWLLQDDSNYANKTSINTSSNINPNNTIVNTNGIGNSGKDPNNLGNMNLYIYNEPSNPELPIIDEPVNLVNVCNSNGNSNNNNNNNNTNSINNDNNCVNDNINSNDNINVNCNSTLDGSNLVMSGGMIGNVNILGSPILESGGLSPDIKYSNYMSNSLLVDDQRDQCGYHDYRTNLMDLKTEMTPKFDYIPQGGGSISKQVVNDCIFDEPYCDKRVPVDSNSLVSTAISSPASIGPEKNYIPASSMGLDMLLMPPTVDLKQNNNGSQHSYPKGLSGPSNNSCSDNNPHGNSNDVNSSNNNNNNVIRNSVGTISNSTNYGFNYNFEDSENVINPSISLSNCDVPWPLTESDQFLHFNDNDNAISSSPSASSSISYLDLDSSAEAKQYSMGISTTPNKRYDIGNTFSDFVYCGDSLGIDLLNVYTNLRDSSSPIIDNADVTDFI
ncbi:MYB domain-containing protein [Cryptosporidium ubiquitum]|uniref:MYB domain-containing protein n=1 Tax=Cryptosporidium ubiquitum TaxID=857276 RepID=A0A1J4MD30_9CRYT|nr:MYB domain-containing protein [Cryptosporidium ubiquitum]OII71395.1 MYB domain-containing protein [Cryptosporidium ubiquitum]